MKLQIYNFFVNRQPEIRARYHRVHDGATGVKKGISYLYLLWMNIAYYVFRFFGKRPEIEYYEQKKLLLKDSESTTHVQKTAKTVDEFVQKILDYDTISFDIFDTLLFRSVAQPTDVFYFVGEQMGIMDFKNIRTGAEWDARLKWKERTGNMEVGLREIWKNLAKDVGCDAEEGIACEKEMETRLCYANPFMLEVWKELRRQGKRIIVVSDMYLPLDFISQLLEKNGFTGAAKIYVSCEYQKSKAAGDLFSLVKREEKMASIVHVGDNPHSDDKMAKKQGLAVCFYQNINVNMQKYRPYDMSYLIGSAYRALVSAHLYNGLHTYSMEYEYGYLYGGLFVLGYCHFIHEYAAAHDIDKILFLSRDGDILQQVYQLLYPDEETTYSYLSRKAATKLMADEDRHDYFRRFLYHKVNQDYTIEEILASMELTCLIDHLPDWETIWLQHTKKQEENSRQLAIKQLHENAKSEQGYIKKIKLTDKNACLLRRFIEAHWEKVMEVYAPQRAGAQAYYTEILKGSKNVVAVDIGWAGSGALALDHLVEKVWKMPCTITGLIAGTNTAHNAEPDASEPFLQSGRLVAYLYSQQHNRDLLKKHDPNKDYNVYWELLLSSPQPVFEGFGMDAAGNATMSFGKTDANPEGIREIQQGILDFAKQYIERFAAFPYMFRISGRDAYAPMLVAASHQEKYLKAIKAKFDLHINVE